MRACEPLEEGRLGGEGVGVTGTSLEAKELDVQRGREGQRIRREEGLP